jgi:hypothetical protein
MIAMADADEVPHRGAFVITLLGGALLLIMIASCSSSDTTTETHAGRSFTQADVQAAKRDGFHSGYVVGYAKGYRLGQQYICNALYGADGQTSDGWHRDSADPVNGPLHKATVLVWYADAPNEVPYAITKSMCLANSKS